MKYENFILYLGILLQSLLTTIFAVNNSPFNVIPCKVPLFAEIDVSETNFLFGVLLSQIDGCGCRLDWRKREDYINKYADTQQILGPLVLVATGGPNREEQDTFLRIPQGQEIILLHPSDETISQTNPAIYGEVKVIMRNYFHAQLNDSSMEYLVSDSKNTTNNTKLLWMPLGLANLKPLPKALRRDFLGRPSLWSWAGSTGSKPERSEMLEALNNHASSARITQLGALHTFNSYAGRPVGSQNSMTMWEYSVLLHNTQFLPVPAGISAEQFRVWEAFEAGCIPILLEKHLGTGAVLYPLSYLDFHVILLKSWAELPDKLLYLHGEMMREPRQFLSMQRHNGKIWARVKHSLALKIAGEVCENT